MAELYRSLISVLKDLVFVETKLCSRCVIVRLKRAVERTNWTDIAFAIQQRVANRARSSVCSFHRPGRACVQLPALANRSRVYTGLPCTDAANSSSFRRCSQFNFVGTSTTTLKTSEYDEPNDACPVMQKGRLLASFGSFRLLPYPTLSFGETSQAAF